MRSSSTNWNLSVNVHSCHIWFTITLHHTQEFPSVSFIKTSMVSDQIDRRNTCGAQIFYCHVQQISCNALAAIIFLRKNGANIRGQVFSVMEIIFNNSQSSHNLIAIQTQIPSVFCFLAEICVHALQICFRWNSPLVVKPFSSRNQPFGHFSQRNILIFSHNDTSSNSSLSNWRGSA